MCFPSRRLRPYKKAYPDGNIFYKDATPKEDHFMQLCVKLPESLRGAITGRLPRLELTLLAVNDSGERVVVV